MKKQKKANKIEQTEKTVSAKEMGLLEEQAAEVSQNQSDEDKEEEEIVAETQIFGVSQGDAEAQAAYQQYLQKKAKKKAVKQETAVTRETVPETEEDKKTEELPAAAVPEEVALQQPEDKPVVSKPAEEPEEELPTESEFEEIDLEVIGQETEGTKKSWLWWCIGIAAVIALVLLVMWMWPKEEENGGSSADHTENISSTGTEGDTEEPQVSEGTQEQPEVSTDEEDTQEYSIEYSLNQDVDAAVTQLLEAYYQATQNCELDTLKSLYYVPLNAPVTIEVLNRKAGIIEAYENITCYSADGLNADELILYVYFEIKFKEIETSAPTLTRFYLKQLEDGSWKIYNGSMSDALRQHLDKMTAHQEVISLMVQVNRAFSQACERDEKLSKLILLLGETAPSVEDESNPSEEETSSESENDSENTSEDAAEDVSEITSEMASEAPAA